MVPRGRIELPTPAFSGPRSTGELPRHRNNKRFYGKQAAKERAGIGQSRQEPTAEVQSTQRIPQRTPKSLRPLHLCGRFGFSFCGSEAKSLAREGSLVEQTAPDSGQRSWSSRKSIRDANCADGHFIDSSNSRIQSFFLRTSRGLAPSAGPTMPSFSIKSIRRAARP